MMKRDPRIVQREQAAKLLRKLERRVLPVVERALAHVADKFTREIRAAEPVDRAELERLAVLWGVEVPEIIAALEVVYRASTNAAFRRFRPGSTIAARRAAEYVEGASARLAHFGDGLAADASRVLSEAVLEGGGYTAARRRLVEAFARGGVELGLGRADRIARTQTHEAWNRGTHDAARQMEDGPRYHAWVATADTRTRVEHWLADGQIQPLEEPFVVGGEALLYPGDPAGSAGNVVNCLLGDTQVAWPGQDVLATTRRSYTGAIVKLTTARGHVISITPNHPVLTPSGYLPAQLLHEGDDVLATLAPVGNESEVDDVLPRVEELFHAMREVGPSTWVRGRSVDFHGDGTDEDVDVVRSDRGLVDDWQLRASKRTQQRQLVYVGRASRSFPSASHLENPRGDDHATWARHLQDAFAAGITPCKVVKIERSWSTHDVYNLQTSDGWYTGNGIVCHNCRCVEILTESVEAIDMTGRQFLSDDEIAEVERFFEETYDVRKVAAATRIAYSDDVVEAAADGPFTGAIVSLLPSEADAARLAIDGFERPEILHVTLSFLGDTDPDGDVPAPGREFDEAVADVRDAVADLGAIEANVFGYAVFNPINDDYKTALVVLLSSDSLQVLCDRVRVVAPDVGTFATWIPHLTVAYDYEECPVGTLNERMGPVTFDRVRVAYGEGQAEEIVLGKKEDNVPDNDDAEAAMEVVVFKSARIRAATLVDLPAFPDAKIKIVGELDTDGMQPWESDPGIAYVGVQTGDGRVFGSITWADAPLPLRWAKEDQGWHFGAVVVGRIDELREEGGVVSSRGVIDTNLPEGAAVVALIGNNMGGGVSIDIDEVEIEQIDFDGERDMTASVVGAIDLPVAPLDVAWDPDGARERILEWATDSGGEVDPAKLAMAFLWRDDERDATDVGSYALGYADVRAGEDLAIVPAAVTSLADPDGVDSLDVEDAVRDALRARACELFDVLRETFDDPAIFCPWDLEDGGDEDMETELEASAWDEFARQAELEPLPAAWFQEPEDLPADAGGVHVEGGRIYGWVARRGVRDRVLGRTPDQILPKTDTSYFLRHTLPLDDGTHACVGAFTMNVGHHRDGAECETPSCQMDDTRTVAGIVTVGVNDRGMWFSGAGAPWLSKWDRRVFAACQPSAHWRWQDNAWQLRAVLTVPVPGFPTPLAASADAVVHRGNVAIAAAASDAAATRAGTFPLHDDRNHAWDGATAEKRVQRWASRDGSGNRDTIDWDRYASAHLWSTTKSDDAYESFGGHKMKFVDIFDDDDAHAVWRAITAAAAIMKGGRGGVDIPDADRAEVWTKICAYYDTAASKYDDDSIECPRDGARDEMLVAAVADEVEARQRRRRERDQLAARVRPIEVARLGERVMQSLHLGGQHDQKSHGRRGGGSGGGGSTGGGGTGGVEADVAWVQREA